MDMEIFKIKPTSWSVPFLLCYMLAILLEVALKVINVFTKLHVTYCPRGMLAFGSSLVLYDRLRSSISLDYEPIYSVSEGFSRSAKSYDLWYQNYRNKKNSQKAESTQPDRHWTFCLCVWAESVGEWEQRVNNNFFYYISSVKWTLKAAKRNRKRFCWAIWYFYRDFYYLRGKNVCEFK